MSEVPKVTITLPLLLEAVRWVMEVKVKAFLALPGCDPSKKESFLFTGLDLNRYFAFASNPPMTEIPGDANKHPRAKYVLVRLGALQQYWWSCIIGVDSGEYPELSHPKEIGVTPAYFVNLYMLDVYRKGLYKAVRFESPRQQVTPYDGKPNRFKAFLASLRASASNACPEMVRCMDNRVFAESMPDLNRTLFNWMLGQVDRNTG